jgi:hypothetical protein
MLFWPAPEIGDKIRTQSGRVFEVVSVYPVHMYEYPVHFEITLGELPDTDAVAMMPTPETFLHTSPAPRRQFGRVTNLVDAERSRLNGSGATASTYPATDAQLQDVAGTGDER